MCCAHANACDGNPILFHFKILHYYYYIRWILQNETEKGRETETASDSELMPRNMAMRKGETGKNNKQMERESCHLTRSLMPFAMSWPLDDHDNDNGNDDGNGEDEHVVTSLAFVDDVGVFCTFIFIN